MSMLSLVNQEPLLAAIAICVAPARCATDRILTVSPKRTSLSPSKITGISFCASMSGRSSDSISANVVGVLLTKISFCGVTVITICRGSDFVSSTCGKLILAPDCTIATLVTIKMINSTKKMSVNGVMLISAIMAEPLPFFLFGLAIPMSFPPQANRFEYTVRPNRHDRLNPLKFCMEVVVENNRHNRHGQPKRCRHQRLGNTASHDRKTASALDGHIMEGFNDPDHRAEQADKRSAD